MAQARIIVRGEILERSQELLQATKLGSLTELFTVLVSRYGSHLESTWVITASTCCSSERKQKATLSAATIPTISKIEQTDFDGELTGV